jgi:ABC-type ATPase with predicted acetyltransferase domain
MTGYHIEFWRGHERVFGDEGGEYRSLYAASRHIHEQLREMMTDHRAEDWTGCCFMVTTEEGKRVFEVPVLAEMSAMARRAAHSGTHAAPRVRTKTPQMSRSHQGSQNEATVPMADLGNAP